MLCLFLFPLCKVWDVKRLVAHRLDNTNNDKDNLLCFQHKPVYMFSTGAYSSFVLKGEKKLPYSSVEVVQINRSDKVTYHGQGKLAVYPTLDLQWNYHVDLHWYVHALEEVVARSAPHRHE